MDYFSTFTDLLRTVTIDCNYKFQEQELQETGFYAFKWRQYMPDVGRFFNVDPLATKYPYNSPYAFQENKMGLGRELEGLELVQDYRKAPQKSMIYSSFETKTNKLGGNGIVGQFIRMMTPTATNNLSVETTQTKTSYIYKKNYEVVDSKSKADYLMVHKEEVKYTNDQSTLHTAQSVTTTEKQVTNIYEDYTIKNGKIEQVKMDNSPITNNTVVNLSDTPQTHQTATLKANEENTKGANSGVVNAMKDNVSSYNEYQLRNIGVPQSELNKVPESAKKSW